MDARHVPDQLSLFTRPPAGVRLASHFLDMAWLCISHQRHITEQAYGTILAAMAYARETIVAEVYIEQKIRGLVDIPRKPPLSGPASIQAHQDRIRAAS